MSQQLERGCLTAVSSCRSPPVLGCCRVLHCLQSYFLNELAVDILSARSLLLLELLAAVVMQQEGSERQPGDVTASAELPGEGVVVVVVGVRVVMPAPRAVRAPTSDLIKPPC